MRKILIDLKFLFVVAFCFGLSCTFAQSRLIIVGDAVPNGWDLEGAAVLLKTEHSDYYPSTLADHSYKAPLYWSVYEYCYNLESRGVSSSDMDITSSQWNDIIDWVSTNLKPYGYDMICTDGFIPMTSSDGSGYMSHYGSVSLATLAGRCKNKGLKLGVYDNPLWIHASDEKLIPGTNYTFGSLKYISSDYSLNPDASDKWFNWAMVNHPGFAEYIDGFFKHYYDLGVEYIRMDFLSWFEDGTDRNLGTVGRGYGRDAYTVALKAIATAARKYGIFTSMVMPHLYSDAELESKYGNMVRIVADTAGGGWGQCSSNDMGRSYSTWPNCMNMFDGFTYWSHIAGRNKVILDGDFTRLNTFSSDDERQTVISLQLMAGGPIAVADQESTIGDNLKFYTNEELLELNTDGFVGRPVSADIGGNSPVWYGQMSNDDYVVGLFNRRDSSATVSVNLTNIGADGTWNVRDLWLHSDIGTAEAVFSVTLPAHGCKIIRLSK